MLSTKTGATLTRVCGYVNAGIIIRGRLSITRFEEVVAA
jgi:hypothetical protein